MLVKMRKKNKKIRGKKNRYLEELDHKKKAKNNIEKRINELNFSKNKLLEHETEKQIQNTSSQIAYIIIKLKRVSKRINDIAMNNNH
jgi:hypothetical protein